MMSSKNLRMGKCSKDEEGFRDVEEDHTVHSPLPFADLPPDNPTMDTAEVDSEISRRVGRVDDDEAGASRAGVVCGAREKRKKRKAWTFEEHTWFLRGLEVCVRGDWRGISRNFVPTRTPSQVASHAQKFFKHPHKLGGKKWKKLSNFDITTLQDAMDRRLQMQPQPPPIDIDYFDLPELQANTYSHTSNAMFVAAAPNSTQSGHAINQQAMFVPQSSNQPVFVPGHAINQQAVFGPGHAINQENMFGPGHDANRGS